MTAYTQQLDQKRRAIQLGEEAARAALPEIKRKHFGHHLVELAAGFILTAVLAYILESRAGAVQHQDWEFYATVICLYLIFAFPCFVWRYFWHARNRE